MCAPGQPRPASDPENLSQPENPCHREPDFATRWPNQRPMPTNDPRSTDRKMDLRTGPVSNGSMKTWKQIMRQSAQFAAFCPKQPERVVIESARNRFVLPPPFVQSNATNLAGRRRTRQDRTVPITTNRDDGLDRATVIPEAPASSRDRRAVLATSGAASRPPDAGACPVSPSSGRPIVGSARRQVAAGHSPFRRLRSDNRDRADRNRTCTPEGTGS